MSEWSYSILQNMKSSKKQYIELMFSFEPVDLWWVLLEVVKFVNGWEGMKEFPAFVQLYCYRKWLDSSCNSKVKYPHGTRSSEVNPIVVAWEAPSIIVRILLVDDDKAVFGIERHCYILNMRSSDRRRLSFAKSNTEQKYCSSTKKSWKSRKQESRWKLMWLMLSGVLACSFDEYASRTRIAQDHFLPPTYSFKH